MSRDYNSDHLSNSFPGKKGLTVKVFNNNINGALTQLKKRCAAEGITQELRKRKNFETNTVKRRRELAEAKSRWRKKQAQIAGLETAKKKKPKDPRR